LSLWILFLTAIPVAWLVPNHYFPWLSAWQDGWSLALLFASAAVVRTSGEIPKALGLFVILAAGSVLVQSLTGRVYFGGDALMALLYLCAFAFALTLGSALARGPDAIGLDAFALAMTCSACLSVGVALVQWSGAFSLGIYGAEMAPGMRPFGNVAQPNHLCTLTFLGLCGLGLLRESGRVAGRTFLFAAAFLILGMVMSASRTGWLQMAALLILACARARRVGARTSSLQIAGLAALYACLTWAWPALNQAVLLSGGRGVIVQIEGGVRGPLWWALMDAIGREPIWGYGWQQMVMAQERVALDHSPLLHHFDHSHNLVLDALIWTGIPIGATLLVLFAWPMGRQLRDLVDARAFWLTAAVLGVLAHAMVEFPLEYAYFLVPTGIAIGAAQALSSQPSSWSVPKPAMALAGGLLFALLTWIAAEYLAAEQNLRLLRLENARVGTTRIESSAPDLVLLTQLGALLQAGRVDPRPAMPKEEIELLRRVGERYAYMQSMYRYALAAGLNGEPLGARLTLLRLCSIHPAASCMAAHDQWTAERIRHPALDPWPADRGR
jgi:hypothetical protein